MNIPIRLLFMLVGSCVPFWRYPKTLSLLSGLGLAGIVFVGAHPKCALGDPLAPARLRSVEPQVKVWRKHKKWVDAYERIPVNFGEDVRTNKTGSASLVLNREAIIKIRSGAQVHFALSKAPGLPLVVRLLGGLGEVFIQAKGPVEVRTAAGTAAVQGASYSGDSDDEGALYSVRLDGEDKTVVTVKKGIVQFYNDYNNDGVINEVNVGPNQQSQATTTSAPTAPVRVDASGILAWTGDVGGLPLPFELPMSRVTAPQDPLESALNAAKTQLAKGQALTAQESFRALLNSPRDDEARAGLALAYLSNQQRSEARDAVVNATTPLATGVRALLLLEDGDASGAQELLLPLAQAPNAPFQIVSLLALAQIQTSDLALAQKTAQQSVGLAPQSAGAYATLALAQFFAHGDDSLALKNARRALDLDPFSPLALLAVGRIEAAHGNLDDARAAIEQAALLAPNLPGVQGDLGAIEAALDRLPRAERAYRAALTIKPDDPRLLAGLGGVLRAQQRRDEARPLLDQAAQSAPTDPYVRAQRANYLLEGRSKSDLEAATREGDFLLAQEQNPASRAELVANDPALGNLFVALSEASLLLQRLNEARRYASAAVRLLPSSSLAQYQLGRVFLEQGLVTQAQSRFLLATILDSKAARPRYALGYTQDLIAQGSDIARPLGQIQAAREGATNVALSLQNLSSPGATQLFQALAQDPITPRPASRSYGDWQLNGSLGTNSSASGELSYLHQSNDGRGLTAFGLSRDTTQGARKGSDSDESRVALTLGRKSKFSPSGIFAFTSFDQVHPNTDIDFDQPASPINLRRQNPLAIIGGNFDSGSGNTRFVFGAGRDLLDASFPFLVDSTLNTNYTSLHAEVRHDQRLSDHLSVNTGLSMGQRRYDTAAAGSYTLPAGTTHYFINSNGVAHNALAYARLDFEPSSRLKLEAEVKAQSVEFHSMASTRFEPVPTGSPATPPATTRSSYSTMLPTFVGSYRVGRATLVRLRARRLLGGINDFQLLSPTDQFGFDTSDDVPQLDLGSRGTSYELEANHTFSNSSFLRVGLFRVSQGSGARLDTGEILNHSRVQGLRVGYEGLLNTHTSYFTSASLNGSRGLVSRSDGEGFYSPSSLSGFPQYSAEAGLQYLSDSGFFVQPSVGYLGPRYRARFDGTDTRQQLGGVPLVNLRIGKRDGLRRSFYVEVSNLFNRTYSLAVNDFQRLQPGRQFRVGSVIRF